MSDKSDIEWTDATWSPTTGCDRVSAGCDNCYALTMAKRLKAMGSAKYQRDGDPRTSGPGFGLTVHEDVLSLPFKWRKPKRIFVNSMSDLFHDDVPSAFIAEVFAVMTLSPQHIFQVLTKRHARMRSLLGSDVFRADVARFAMERAEAEPGPPYVPVEYVVTCGRSWWPLPNVWLGVSVEDQKWADIRIPALLHTPAAVRWLSCEPLLGPVDLTEVAPGTVYANRGFNALVGEGSINWVVVGGESGPGSRPMHPDWARSLRNQCAHVDAPFFFKQHGQYAPVLDRPRAGDVWVARDGAMADWSPSDGHTRNGLGDFRWPSTGTVVMRRSRSKHDAGRLLDGRTWDEYPAAALATA